MYKTSILELQAAVEAGDIQAVEVAPVARELNATSAFCAPMMLSAHNLKHLAKIPEIAADCIMLNLEDGVAPEQKPMALRLCMAALSKLPQCDKKIVVRVNPLEEGGEREIAMVSAYRPDAIRIPKVRSVDDVTRALSLMDPAIELHLSVETKEAWLNLASLRPDPQVSTFYLGILDMLADLGMDQGMIAPDNPTIHAMLAHFLLTGRALGVKPVSFVFQDFRDLETFDVWLALEKQMGFDAKGCISPKQAERAIAVFGPDEAALQRAREIVGKFEAMRAQGVTGFTDETCGFIDEPIYKGALAVLGRGR